jgi:uncharacterized membrane protein
MAVVVGLLVLIVLVSVTKRLVIDVPHLIAGTLPDEVFDQRYVNHAWIGYAHLAPGAIYLLGAPLQLSYRFRSRHYQVHRRLGRVVLAAGLISGVFAIVFGLLFSFGGALEAAAAVVFGAWFVFCLFCAFRAIRGGDVVTHRRWMIRAFAVGLGVGTVRIWLVLFQAFGLLDFHDSFGPAFWLGFSLHALVAEVWLRRTPHPAG